MGVWAAAAAVLLAGGGAEAGRHLFRMQSVRPHPINVHRKVASGVVLSGGVDHSKGYEYLSDHHRQFAVENVNFVTYRGGHPLGGGALGAHGSRQDKQRAASSSISSSGTLAAVPMTPSKFHQFRGKVAVGTPPQYFDVIFDTGSTNFWIVDEECDSQTCRKVKRFDSRKSSSFDDTGSLPLDIQFGTGRVQGRTARETVRIGPYEIKGQPIGRVLREERDLYDDESSNVFDEIDFEGILGLAFPAMASGGAVPVYDKLVETGQIHDTTFSFAFLEPSIESIEDTRSIASQRDPKAPAAVVMFGPPDERLHEGSIQYSPVIREYYWEVPLKELWIGDRKFCCDDAARTGGMPSYVIFDSGTTFNTMPSNELREFFDIVKPESPCTSSSLADYPNIRYVLKGDVVMDLTPAMYLIRSSESGDATPSSSSSSSSPANETCKPAYMGVDVPSEFGHAYVFGVHPVMKQFYTVYKRGKNGEPSQVGIAKIKSDHTTKALLQELLKDSSEGAASRDLPLSPSSSSSLSSPSSAMSRSWRHFYR